MKQWPEKEMAVREKGELQEELLSFALPPAEISVHIEEDGVQEWGQVRWVVKAAELAAQAGDTGGSLITQVLKNVPDSLMLCLGPKHRTWEELVESMREIPPADIQSVVHTEKRLVELEVQVANANSTIAVLQQTPMRGLTNQFAGMAASSPTHTDPVRRTLFPTAACNSPPDAERLQTILAMAVTIHPRTPTGLVAYTQQVAAYTQKHGRKPNDDRPYPLTLV
jgi:hypothetical protein